MFTRRIRSSAALLHSPFLKAGRCPAGYVKLELPVFHIGYFRNTIAILNCICKSCSRVMLEGEEHRRFFK